MRTWISLGTTAGVLAAMVSTFAFADAASNAMFQTEVDVTNKVADICAANRDNCAKLGKELDALISANAAKIKSFRTFAKNMTPTQKADFKKNYASKVQDATNRMRPALTTCQGDRQVRTAMKKFND